MDPKENFAISLVATAPSPATTGTSLTVTSTDGSLFPQPSTDGAFNVVVFPTGEQPSWSNAEIVRATARSTDTFTIIREQEGTSARTIVVGDIVMLPSMSAKDWNDIKDSIDALLSSPILTTPQINDTSSDHQYIFAPSELTADRTVTLPLLTGNDEFVFKDHTQTLTNKTLTSPLFQGIVGGWISPSVTWEYVSVDDPTGVFRVNADVTTELSVGMRIKMTNGGHTIYGIITAVGSYSGGYTNITFLHEIDPTDSLALYLMANSAITANYYSTQKAPYGFPMSPAKWRVITTDSTYRAGSTTQNLWANISQLNIVVPIGVWDVRQKFNMYVSRATAGIADNGFTLSTANNTESNTESTAYNYGRGDTDGERFETGDTIENTFLLEMTTKTTLYTNVRTKQPSITSHGIDGATVRSIISLTCAYL